MSKRNKHKNKKQKKEIIEVEEEHTIDFSKLNIINYHKGMQFEKGNFYRYPKGVIFRFIENKLYKGLVKIGEEEVELKDELLEIRIPKLPYEIVDKIHNFFQVIYDTYATEAIVILWYNFSTRKWEIEVPTQKVSSASANYERKAEDIETLERAGYTIVGSVHSHGQMGAFHSSVDDDDEFKFDGLHITIGHVNTGPEFACRFIMKDLECKLEPEQCMEVKVIEHRFPVTWLERVEHRTKTKITTDTDLDEQIGNIKSNVNNYLNEDWWKTGD